MSPRRASSSGTQSRSDARVSDRRLIQSVDRSARLLRAIATSRHPLSVAELAAACELNRSTTWRLLATLEHHGLVERDDVSQRYAIGYGLVRLAAGKTDHAILIRAARPALERTAAETAETVNLSIALSSGMVLCIDQVDAVPMVGVNWLDRPLPWHCTSAGKLHLAYLSSAEVDAYLSRTRLEAFTPRTITSPEKLRADLARTRKRGYSLALEEQEIGLNATSVGILRDGAPVALVSVSGPAFRLSATVIQRIGRNLVQAGEEIAEHLAAGRSIAGTSA